MPENPGMPGHFRDLLATRYERLGIDVATTQFADFAGRNIIVGSRSGAQTNFCPAVSCVPQKS